MKLKNGIAKHILLTVCIVPVSYAQDYNAINQSISDDIVQAGDVLAIAIPATGFAAAWLYDDYEGAKQLTISAIAAQTITEMTKHTVGRYRPNSDLAGASYKSFPSGHAAGAFSGAAFLQTRYGATWGIPAYAAATFVAASRVHGNRHYPDDVLAGASLGFLVNQYVVSPYVKDGVVIQFSPNNDGGAYIGVSINEGAWQYDQGRQRGSGALPKKKRHRFQLDVGFNTLDSLGESGVQDLLPDSQLVDDHQPFSVATYEYALTTESSIEIQLAPSETRRYGKADHDFEVGGSSYPVGADVYLAFKQWNLGGTYYKHLWLNEKLQVSIGAGLYSYLVELESDYLQGGRYAKETSWELMPSVAGRAQYRLGKGLSIAAATHYQTTGRNTVSLIESGLNYTLNQEWDVGLKYAVSRSHWRSVDVKYNTDSVILSISNRF